MSDKSFSFVIQTPDGKKFSDSADLINLRLSDGAIGILKGRYPLIGIIDICHMDYVHDGKTEYLSLGGGILDVRKGITYILADSFERKEDIDKARAEEAKNRAEERLKKAKEGDSEVDIKRAELALKRAMNRLSL